MRATVDVVTGAFSYSGAAIARDLQAAGRRVRTLTGHPQRRPDNSPIEVRPLRFDDPSELVESMRGAETLYNTYWVRFPHGRIDFQTVVTHELGHATWRWMSAATLSSPWISTRFTPNVPRLLLSVAIASSIRACSPAA